MRQALVDLLESRELLSASYLVAGSNANSAIFDVTRNRLYVTAGSSILRFDLNTKTTLSPWTNVGNSLGGGDITTDGKYLYVADQTTVGSQSLVQKIDLNTGAVKHMPYAIDYDDSARQVIITSDNKAIIGHSGQWGDVHSIDLATDKFITADQTNTYGVSMFRGKDRSLVIASDGLSPPETTMYDAKTHAWTGGGWNTGVGDVAISPDGNEVATYNGYLDRTLTLLRTRGSSSTPLGYDPTGKLLYTFEPKSSDYYDTGGGTVVARDTQTDVSRSSFTVTDDIHGEVPSLGAVTSDGKWIVMIGDLGAHLFALTPANASIAGTVFLDANNNHTQSGSTEVGLKDVRVYLDDNQNGQFDSGETSAKSDASGKYKLSGLDSGTYHVRQEVPGGYSAGGASGGSIDVHVGDAAASTGNNFGNLANASIAGSVFADQDGNGKYDSDDDGLAGVRVYLDLNKNGKLDSGEPSIKTKSAGTYKFSSLAAGTSYQIRQIQPGGYGLSAPSLGFFDVTLASGATIKGKAFGNAPAGSISGMVFNDANENAQRDVGEMGLGLWTVYIDSDNDGKLDQGEMKTTTDINGRWRLDGVVAGKHYVRMQTVDGMTVTTSVSGRIVVTLGVGRAMKNKLFGVRSMD